MTRVDFYRIGGTLQDSVPLVAALVAKAITRGYDIFIQVPDAACARTYLPALQHACGTVNIGMDGDTPHAVTLGWDEPDQHGLMINLTPAIPHWFSRFRRLAEIVYDDETVTTVKRTHFRYYRERGYPLHFHDLSRHDKTPEQP